MSPDPRLNKNFGRSRGGSIRVKSNLPTYLLLFIYLYLLYDLHDQVGILQSYLNICCIRYDQCLQMLLMCIGVTPRWILSLGGKTFFPTLVFNYFTKASVLYLNCFSFILITRKSVCTLPTCYVRTQHMPQAWALLAILTCAALFLMQMQSKH